MAKLALEAIDISKKFGDFVALDNVSLQLRKNSFHALLGENGAGKSTLVKCIMGFYQATSGSVLLNDKEHDIHSPATAKSLGIGMVYQQFTLVPNMTVAENLVLAKPHLPAVIHWREERQWLEAKLADLPFDIDLDARIDDLAAGQKQKVEIVKQLILDISVLILDEPTSVLTPNEADEMLAQVKQLTHERDLSVLMITHKFREVFQYTDAVTVLRKGKLAGGGSVSELTSTQLAEMMLATECNLDKVIHDRDRLADSQQDISLAIDKLQVLNDLGLPVVNQLSLNVAGGEIVGVAGVSGNGQKEFVEAIAGQRDIAAGTMLVSGATYQHTREQNHHYAVACLPEEPLRNATVQNLSVAENMALRDFDREPFVSAKYLLRRSQITRRAKQLIDAFRVRPTTPNVPIESLSGGNVQRAVLARELSGKVNILVVANPCFGLDFNAVREIRARIMEARNAGAAVLLVSEDLDEILELADRIVVMSGGQLVFETTPADVDLNEVGRYMAGH